MDKAIDSLIIHLGDSSDYMSSDEEFGVCLKMNE
jgi:hypothetical protein